MGSKVYMPSVSILASVALAAIVKLSLAGETIVKLGLQSEVLSRKHPSRDAIFLVQNPK